MQGDRAHPNPASRPDCRVDGLGGGFMPDFGRNSMRASYFRAVFSRDGAMPHRRLARAGAKIALLGAVIALAAGCSKPEAPPPAGRSHGAQGRAARHADHLRIHRADAEPAAGQHRGAGQRLSRQAALHGRRHRQGRPGAVPDGPEAVHRPAERSAGGAGIRPRPRTTPRRPT